MAMAQSTGTGSGNGAVGGGALRFADLLMNGGLPAVDLLDPVEAWVLARREVLRPA